jgi:hypothetical protein
LRAAAAGELADPKGLASQVDRMLADLKAAALVDNFARQWLGLDKLAGVMPEPKLFPGWSEDLRDACRAETLGFFRTVLAEDRPITDFLAADWTVMNEALAEHYGIKDVTGRVMRKVTLPDEKRGGLLTQAGVLTLTSEATRTSPVIRGKYVLDHLFNRPPPPPPPNVDGLMPDVSTARSVREQLELHRKAPNCAGCHARIDPYGMALENFDANGAWRTEEPAWEDPARPLPRKDKYQKIPPIPVDSSTVLADGTALKGLPDLKAHLLARKDDFLRGLTEKLLVYAAGRGLLDADRPAVERAVGEARRDGYRIRALVHAVVRSNVFQTR